jgi:hypothetical protein
METVTTVVKPQICLNYIKVDSDDNHVLECAVVGSAAYIVSGNDHLLKLDKYEQIVVLLLVGFLAVLKLENSEGASGDRGCYGFNALGQIISRPLCELVLFYEYPLHFSQAKRLEYLRRYCL